MNENKLFLGTLCALTALVSGAAGVADVQSATVTKLDALTSLNAPIGAFEMRGFADQHTHLNTDGIFDHHNHDNVDRSVEPEPQSRTANEKFTV